MILLSICIPTFNRADILKANLNILIPQCEGRPVEICISNNASSDHTLETLSAFPTLRVQTQASNIGIDRNILAALRMAQGQYVLPIGDDETLIPGSIESILQSLQAAPDMLILNGRQRVPLTDLRDAFRRLWDQMPLGGFAIRREYAAPEFTDRYLDTHHAYSGAAWDFLLRLKSPRIDCTAQAVVRFNDVPKAWSADRRRILTEDIPRWFDLLPDFYKSVVAPARRTYTRTWGQSDTITMPAICFITGIVLAIPFNLVGNILAGEILLAIAALGGALANRQDPGFPDRRLVLFTTLFVVSLCVYVATDVLWETPLHDAARGWARFVFLIADFAGIYVIGRRSRFNLFPLLIGYMFGQVAVWAVPRSGNDWYIAAWKHHLCLPVIVGLLCASGLWSKRASTSLAILVLAGLVSFQADTRAFGMLCFVAAAIVAARALITGRARRLMPLAMLLALLTTSFGISVLLDQTTARFGRRQSNSNIMRYAAIVTATQTIARHPWTGIGSWKNDFEAASRHRANVMEAGGNHDSESFDQSGHSQILQTWLEGGPLAAAAFLYMLWRMLRSLQWTLSRPADGFLAFSVFVLLNGIWSCLFSPFLGADIRVNAAIAIYVCIDLTREKMNFSRARA